MVSKSNFGAFFQDTFFLCSITPNHYRCFMFEISSEYTSSPVIPLYLCIYQLAVADLGEGLGDPPPLLFWVKKLQKGRRAGREIRNKNTKRAS